MQSNNPVFRRSEAFNGTSTNAYGNQTYPGNGATYQGYGQAPGHDQPQYGAPAHHRAADDDRLGRPEDRDLARRRDRLRRRHLVVHRRHPPDAADVERTSAPSTAP